MIIKKLTIVNFRSYYGKKEFVFSDHLNLILGSNGDGKTTFFDALNWVLTPDYAPKSNDDKLPEISTLVSAKMFRELQVGVKGRVLVSLEMKNNTGQTRIAERAFDVYKKADGKMQVENLTHKAYQTVGMMRKELFSIRDLFEKENVFPAVIKKYHIFKGEDKLNIFNDKSTLQSLIDMFAEINDLDPIRKFAAYALDTAEKAVAGTKEKSQKVDAKAAAIKREIDRSTKDLDKAYNELTKARNDYDEANKHLGSVETDYEAIKKAVGYEQEVSALENEIARLSDKIDERFSIKLLDDQWILLGFNPIMLEFYRKMESLAYSKINIEAEHRKKQEDEQNKVRMLEAKTELEKIAWNRSDVDKMKQMLKVHRCSYCGSPAPEGSVTYDFIQQRINDVINLLTPKPEEKPKDIKPYFLGRNIEELYGIAQSLKHTGKDIPGIKDEIESLLHENEQIRELIAKKSSQVKSIKKKISTLYASSTSGENLQDYVANIAAVDKWHELKRTSSIIIDRLTTKTIPEIKAQIQKKREEQAKNAKVSGADAMLMVSEFFRLFSDAIDETKSSIYDDFLARLAKEANLFLARLNVDDFTGVIKIYIDYRNNLKIELQDKNDKIITNPNTSLLTTMHISILFAIAELTRENRNAEYPLIFDAPTSSFDEGKDKTFYECLNSQVNKQCIVVTKSYLYKNEDGEFAIDNQALNRLNCKKYRIKKLTGFDKLDLTTIDTVVEEIKED
jgi:uncharacterized protein YoxC